MAERNNRVGHGDLRPELLPPRVPAERLEELSRETHPQASDVIFHPPAGLENASAEQLLDEALAYRPIAL